jgi:hypothetical protein
MNKKRMTLDEMRAQVAADDEKNCVALVVPLLGLLMRCSRPCTLCRALAAEVARLQPEWDRVRDQYRRANPDPKRPPTQEQQGRR